MFYATTIKSIGSGGIVDTQGRYLRFIGDLPVKEGDTVYTDGKYIFGNAPPKGSPAIFDEPSGIPVLGDEDESGKDELRGYFTTSGKYKRYRVADGDWITNSEKKFAHGEEEFDDEKVIDADINEDGDEMVVTNSIYQENRELETTYVLIVNSEGRGLRTWQDVTPYSGPYVYNQILGSEKLLKKIDFDDNQDGVPLFMDGKKKKTLDLGTYAKDVEKRSLKSAEEIMKQSFDKSNSKFTNHTERLGTKEWDYWTLEQITQAAMDNYGHLKPQGANPDDVASLSIDEVAKPRPDKPFIAYTVAYVMASNVGEDGFGGTVFAATYGYCFPYIPTRFVIALDEGEYIGKICAIYEYKCVPFGCSCMYKIQDDSDELTPIAFRDFGGFDDDMAFFPNHVFINNVWGSPDGVMTDKMEIRRVTLFSGVEAKEQDELLPVGEGFYQMDKFGRLTFYNSEEKVVARNIPVHEDFCHVEIEHGLFNTLDLAALEFNNTPLLRYKIYTPDGETEKKTMVIDDSIKILSQTDGDANVFVDKTSDVYADPDQPPPVDGYYIKKDDKLEPLQFTPLFYEFKDGSCLCGVKGGKLYKVDTKGHLEQVGDGVKNFRLRELKKISKAKR